MKMTKGLLIALAIVSQLTYAATRGSYNSSLVNADKEITNLESALVALHMKSSIPVIFPIKVPKHNQPLYLSIVQQNSNQYRIFIDTTPSCKGAHFCNVGEIYAAKGESPTLQYSADKQRLTEKVRLNHKEIAYYTPAHAKDNYSPTTISWREDNVLFRISWRVPLDNEEAVIEAMANSIAKLTAAG